MLHSIWHYYIIFVYFHISFICLFVYQLFFFHFSSPFTAPHLKFLPLHPLLVLFPFLISPPLPPLSIFPIYHPFQILSVPPPPSASSRPLSILHPPFLFLPPFPSPACLPPFSLASPSSPTPTPYRRIPLVQSPLLYPPSLLPSPLPRPACIPAATGHHK